MRVSVRLFAGLRERAGTDRLEIELPDDARVADVLAAMAGTPVGALRDRECVVAVNRDYAGADTPVRAGDEVALVPPVSGGDGRVGPAISVRVTGEPLDLAALAAAVRDPRAGAVVLFEGVTREVPKLEYEAYAEMAHERIEAIAREEAERHGLCAVAAVRAVGDRRRVGAPPRRGVRGRPGADRPREGGGADLEGRGRRRRPAARRRHAPAGVGGRRTSTSSG